MATPLELLVEDLSNVPVDPTEFDAWLAAHEDRIAGGFADRYSTLIGRYLRAATRSLTAALVDTAAFDGFLSEMGALAANAADEMADLYLAGGLSAWIKSPADGAATVAEQARWSRVINQQVADYTAVAGNRIRGAAEDTWQEIRGAVIDSTQLGDFTQRELADWISDTQGYGKHRATTIARTEVVGAYNGGTMTGARALPEQFQPVEKEWLAALDARTRPTHVDANGQVVPFNADFTVGGVPMPQPGVGPADEVVNCRCTILLYYPGDTRSDGSLVPDTSLTQNSPQSTSGSE